MSIIDSLYTRFGFGSFRAGQEEAIFALLDHQHTLAIMPTGAGKSLIYQLAALEFDGLTLVISPLIALMKDQVDALNRKGISTTFINSAIPPHEQNQRLTLLERGKYKLVYVAPERLRNVTFLRSIQKITLSLLAIDEAHCISEWGHDFRPDYLHIANARRQLGDPLTVALTATATPQVQDDIIRLLGLPTTTRRIVTGFNRPNLALEVRYSTSLEAKFRSLNELLGKTSLQSAKPGGATLIYTGTRRDAEDVAEFARVVGKAQAEHYHAGLLPDDRARIQERFISGSTPVIVATNAFGMGVDRADVRQVIHFSLPGSLEAYYQEAGRAGRDGYPAQAILLYDPQDRSLQEFFIQSGIVTPGELELLYRALGDGKDQIWMTADDFSRRTGLHEVKVKVGVAELERIGAVEYLGDNNGRMLLRKGKLDPTATRQAAARSREHTRHRTMQLKHMIDYAETNDCRRKIVLHHFGDTGSAEAPVCCDNCESKKSIAEKTTKEKAGVDVVSMSYAEHAALIILDTVRRLGVRQVGCGKLAQILKGSKAKDILQFHYDREHYYGKLAAIQQNQIEDMVRELVSLGHFKIVGGKYPVIKLTPSGEKAIQQKSYIQLKLQHGLAKENSEKKNVLINNIVKSGERKDVESVSDLIALLNHKDANARRLAASALGKIGDKQAVEPLMNLLVVETKAQVRQYAVKALGKIRDKRPLALLQKILDDKKEMEYTRESAKIAIQNLQKKNILSTPTLSISSPALQPASPDLIASYLSSSHPRHLKGSWHTGYALDFHSSYKGADWNRSGVGDLTYRLKYQSDASVLPALVKQAIDLFSTYPEMSQFDVIIPVPSSSPREFDPVPEFSRALANAVDKPMQMCLLKARATKPQKEMHTLPQKRDNVAAAFRLNGDIKGKRILVVDDLFDSGATLEEITKLLLKQKAARVNVLTLTRTIHADE